MTFSGDALFLRIKMGLQLGQVEMNIYEHKCCIVPIGDVGEHINGEKAIPNDLIICSLYEEDFSPRYGLFDAKEKQ